MNSKSRFCIVTCTTLFFLLFVEIFYLQLTHSPTKKEHILQREFVEKMGISNIDLALRDHYIKRLP